MFGWDEENTGHIARHNVAPREAEEALADQRRVPVAAYDVARERRHAITGATKRGRLLTVIYTYHGERRDQRVRVVTAHPPGASERAAYEGS
jgi:uncharacterized protein